MKGAIDRRPWLSAVVALAGLLGTLALGVPTASGQPAAGPSPGATEDQPAVLIVTDARLRGSGPWTSYLGAAPRRELVVDVVNVGRAASAATTLELRMSWSGAGEPAEPITIGPLAPGERRQVRRDVRLPTAAIGTYAVTGSISGAIPAVSFRAETSHAPWVLVAAPLLILVQLALVAARNRVRRRIAPLPPPAEREPAAEEQPVTITAPAPERPVVVTEVGGPAHDPSAVVAEEVAAVFDAALAGVPEGLGEDAMAALVADLAREAADRAADRLSLDDRERAELDAELTRQMLVTFGFEDRVPAAVG